MLRKLVILAAAALVGLGVWVSPFRRRCRRARFRRIGPISRMARPCSLPAVARHATPRPARTTRPSSAAGLRSNRLLAPSTHRIFHRIRTTALAAGARRISSPRWSRVLRLRASISTQPFHIRPISMLAPTICAICLPFSKRCRRCRANRKRMTCRFRSASAAHSGAGSSCSSMASRSSLIRPGRGLGIGRLPGQRLRSLRGVPFAPQCARRRHREAALCRRAGAERRRLGAEHHPEGLSSWSVEQIAKLLETGDTPDGDSVGGEMGKVVGNTRQLSAADRIAIATYIKSLPAVVGPKQPEKK